MANNIFGIDSQGYGSSSSSSSSSTSAIGNFTQNPGFQSMTVLGTTFVGSAYGIAPAKAITIVEGFTTLTNNSALGYTGPVVSSGNATSNGNLTINGNLFVGGSLNTTVSIATTTAPNLALGPTSFIVSSNWMIQNGAIYVASLAANEVTTDTVTLTSNGMTLPETTIEGNAIATTLPLDVSTINNDELTVASSSTSSAQLQINISSEGAPQFNFYNTDNLYPNLRLYSLLWLPDNVLSTGFPLTVSDRAYISSALTVGVVNEANAFPSTSATPNCPIQIGDMQVYNLQTSGMPASVPTFGIALGEIILQQTSYINQNQNTILCVTQPTYTTLPENALNTFTLYGTPINAYFVPT